MKDKKDWFKEKGYLHLSNKIPFKKRPQIKKYVECFSKISKHRFYPLIYKEISQRRYKKGKFGEEVKRSHKTIKKEKVVSTKKVRPILYATHIDAHIYSYYSKEVLGEKYENYLETNKSLSNCITAYRRIKTEDGKSHKNNIHFAKEVFDEIKKRKKCIALAIDVESFFNNLNHKKLKAYWKEILDGDWGDDHYNIFKSVTNFSYIKLADLKKNNLHFDEKKLAINRKLGKHSFFISYKDFLKSGIRIYKNQRKSHFENTKNEPIGIPQGLAISALLANIYMLKFDEYILNNLVEKENCFYRRYSDDIVIICSKKQIENVLSTVKNEIKKYDLNIADDKTEITLFKEISIGKKKRLQCYDFKNPKDKKQNKPFNYLGFEFYGYQTLIKSKNLSSFYREMKDTIRKRDKRIKKVKFKTQVESAPIFKRKIYRLYSYKGSKTSSKRKLGTNKYKNNGDEILRKYSGNFIKYCYKASEILDAPEIKSQIKNHWKILQKT